MSSPATAAVQLFAFGTLGAAVGGTPVTLGPLKQRMLLGLLLCRPGAEVPSDELIDALWSSPPPASAANNLRTYVHGLRRVLGEGLITGNGRPGYRLHTDRLWIDTAEFLAHCETADAALDRDDPATAHTELAAAVALRRGPPYADVSDPTAVAEEAGRLEERWLLAVERRIDLDLKRGQAAELVGELTALVARHPYRERFVVLLMLALYRSGRQTDALAAYRRAAAALDEELGVEPSAELTELHRAVLRQDPALDRPAVAAAAPATVPVVRPAELPSGSAHFTGRVREGAALSAALTEARRRRTLPIVAIVGPAGVGKTSLVVEWAQQVAPEFPDGQIFVDLRGFSAEPVTPPADALRRLLWSLGVEANRVPATADEASALLRSLLFGKRLLLVLDNVVSAAQVAPLLPGGHGNAVVVTSRNGLAGLTARHGAHQVRLEALTDDEALALIGRIVGPDRVAAEPGAARELARRCGHLPLALCIAAATIADEAQTIAAYLAGHRTGAWVSTLRITGDPEQTVMTAFDLSLRSLTERQQRLLTLLGLVPGPSFTADAAAALIGEPVQEDLLRLVHAHLVQRTAVDRFAFHDLIREYARSRADTVGRDDRDAAVRRLYTYYRDVSDAADRVLQPGALRLPIEVDRVWHFPADGQAAQDWFAGELANLVAACRDAAGPDAQRLTTRLADAMASYLWTRVDLDNWSTVAEAAARAARGAGDGQASAAAEIALARIADCRCDFTAGVARYGNAVDLARQANWREGEGVALGSMAALHGELGDPRLAVRRLEAARVISREIGDGLHEGRTLLLLGAYRVDQGELSLAGELFDQAMVLIDREGSRIGRAIISDNIAELLVLRREFDRAAAHAEEALRICEEFDHVSCRISAYVNLSAAYRGRGDATGALPQVQRALAISATPDVRDLGIVLHETAEVYDALGEPGRAVEYHRAAYRLTTSAQTRWLSISHAIALALAEHRLAVRGERGADEPAAPDLHQALEEARHSGYRGLEGAALAALAEVSRDEGQAHESAVFAAQALIRQRECGWWTPRDLLTSMIGGATAGR